MGDDDDHPGETSQSRFVVQSDAEGSLPIGHSPRESPSVLIGMVNWESSRDGDRFDQIPSVAIKVLENGHDAIRFMARLLDEPDAPLGVGEVVTGEVIGFEEQEHPTATLISDRSTLSVTDSPRQ